MESNDATSSTTDAPPTVGGTPPHPFSPRASGRDPFPPFQDAMAPTATTNTTNYDSESGRSALDWSIDTLAELKPVPMTPSTAQKKREERATSTPTPSSVGRDSFFDDPSRFSSLRTPSPIVLAAADASRPPALPPTPLRSTRAPYAGAELHLRCRDAIALYQKRLRDRQRKMDSLHVRPTGRAGSSSSSPPTKRNKPNERDGRAVRPAASGDDTIDSTTTPSSFTGNRRARRSPQWWASPVARTTLSFTSPGLRTPSPSFPTGSPAQSTPEFSPTSGPPSFACELSPIPTVGAASSSPEDDESLSEAKAGRDTPDRGKENQQQQQTADALPVGSGESTATPPTTTSSVARRQEAFAAAMEAEARRRPTSVSSSSMTPPASRNLATPSRGRAGTILALHAEAKALGFSDPRAQWEYVRLLQSSKRR